MRRVIYSFASYPTIVFPLAIGWHLGLFEERYVAFGYFNGVPNIPLGFTSILIQGLALAIIFPLFRPNSRGFVRAFQFTGLMGLFFWTSHVLALVAKQNVPNAMGFLLMETAYLILQFGLFGLALGLIYRTESQRE